MLHLVFLLFLGVAHTQDQVRTLSYDPAHLYFCPDYNSDFIRIESFQFAKDRCNWFQKLMLEGQRFSKDLLFLEKIEICEKSPMAIYRIYRSAKLAVALEKAIFKKYFPDSEGNAVRHCLIAGFLTKNLGHAAAANYLNARELGKSPNQKTDFSESREMDVHNNNSGIKAALQLVESQDFSGENLVKSCVELVNSDSLMVKAKKFPLPIEYDIITVRKAIWYNQ